MEFEFDPAQIAANKAKHGIDFVEDQALWRDGGFVDAPTLRANKSETFDCLKFTLGGAGERFDGNARTSAHAHALAFLA